jgi:iron complex transport system ATP-binding protein
MTSSAQGLGLDLRAVSFGFGAPLFEGASLAVAPGEIAAICGANGSGKSSILKIAASLLSPQSGAVEYAGASAGALDPVALAQARAYLPQHPMLPEGWTVAETVALGDYPWAARPPARRPLQQRVDEARGRFHLDRLWTRTVETLSGGEQRLVLLARTLVQDAPILILDEPGADLDLRNQVNLLRHLAGLAGEGRAILLASHDLNLSLLFGHRVHLLDGRGGFSPLPEERRARGEALEAAFDLSLKHIDWEGTDLFLPIHVLGAGGPGGPGKGEGDPP